MLSNKKTYGRPQQYILWVFQDNGAHIIEVKNSIMPIKKRTPTDPSNFEPIIENLSFIYFSVLSLFNMDIYMYKWELAEQMVEKK